jgi:hypothetical protein
MAFLRNLALEAVVVSLCLGAPLTAQARVWKPSPEALAQDYLEIMDVNNRGHLRAIVWLASPVMQGEPAAQALMDQYVIILVANAGVQPDGIMTFAPAASVKASGADQAQLVQLQSDDFPPTIQGVMTAMQAMFSKSMGSLGSNMQPFVFKAGTVKACEKGQLSVQVDGDTYTYDTPIPGCPSS